VFPLLSATTSLSSGISAYRSRAGDERGSRYIVEMSRGGDGMGDIEALLAGSDPGEPRRLFAAEGVPAGGHEAQAREWCQTSPDHAALMRLAVTLSARRRLRKAVISARRGNA
jgi:hypothetical protein